MKPETEATTEPLTVADVKAATKKMEDEPPRPDYYEDGPEMRRALRVGGSDLCSTCEGSEGQMVDGEWQECHCQL